jgi:hypothetical protein
MLERIKPMPKLVNEMLDHLPKEVWTSNSTTFFDPAIGGGQFVREIERRLKEQGHSVANIRKRVFGFESSQALVDMSINMNKLQGQYKTVSIDHFFKLDNTMKFDVIVGNPPYQGNNDKGTAQPKSHNLWSKFVDKSIDLVKDNGHLAFVTPDSWMSANSQILTKFKEHSLIWCNTDVSKHFSVGSSFTAWVLEKNKNTNQCVIDGIPVNFSKLNYLPRDFHNTYTIHDKVINSAFPKIGAQCDTTCHSDHKHKKLSDTKDSVYKYKTFHTNAQTRFSKLKSKDFDKNKIVWSLSGYFKPFYDNGNIGTTEVCQYLLVADQAEGNNILTYLDSKLYQFIVTTGKWSGFLNGKVIESLPKLPNKKWTNATLYKQFNLTQDEINVIESTIK